MPDQSTRRRAAAIIPGGINFAELKLARDPDTGDVSFDWQPIERICAASGLDPDLFRSGPEDNLAGLLSAWYAQHLAAGGDRDATMDDILAEKEAEDLRGGGFSHSPGRA